MSDDLKELFDLNRKMVADIMANTDSPNHGLLEEALSFFFLDGIGEVDRLKEIYEDAKKRIKVY